MFASQRPSAASPAARAGSKSTPKPSARWSSSWKPPIRAWAERLLDAEGELRRFVNIYVDGDDIRFRDGFDTALDGVDEVSIVPSVAGG